MAKPRQLILADQPVADAGLGDEQLRLGRVRFQFLPQVRQIDAQVVGLLDRVRAPDLAEYLAVGQHLPGVLDEESQEVVFRGG